MGKVFKANSLKILLAFLALALSLIFSKFSFPKVDALTRDLLQLLNPGEVKSNIATVNIDTSDVIFSRPFAYSAIEKLVKDIESTAPKKVVILLEPGDFKDDNDQAKEFLKFLNSRPNVLLSTAISRPGKLSFKNHSVLKFAKNQFTPPIATTDENIGPRDQKRRRTTLAYDNFDPDHLFEELRKIDINPKPVEHFKFPLKIWNTTQAYFKTFRVGTFGNINSNEIVELKSHLAGKVVLVGAFDEFSYFSKPSIFDFFEKPVADNFKSSYFPYHEYMANVLYLFESGEYMKNIEIWDLLFIFMAITSIIFVKITFRLKIICFISLIPLIMLFQVMAYWFNDSYLNFSQSISLLLFLHVFFLPTILIVALNKVEKERQTAINSARIQALESIAEKLAHDIRSPLSTTRLLLTKATFERSEHKELITQAIGRIDNMTQEILNKSKNAIEKVDINLEIRKIFSEKQALHKNINFNLTERDRIVLRIDRSDLHRVIENIIDNAVSVINEMNGEIVIEIRRSPGFAVVEVRDNGPGFTSETLSVIGKMKVRSTKPNGHGIGLFHSKKIIDEYSGKIEVLSNSGQGSVVSVFLPLLAE